MARSEQHRPVSMADLLDQAVFWCTSEGGIIRLADMSHKYLGNVRRWLTGNAGTVQEQVAAELSRDENAAGDKASEAGMRLYLMGQYGDPRGWMDDQPLAREIDRLTSAEAQESRQGREEQVTEIRACPQCGAQPGQQCVSLSSMRGRVLNHPHAARMRQP
jgi:hypothetical protein